MFYTRGVGIVALVVCVLLGAAASVEAGPYFNSAECPANGAGVPNDSNLLYCDDIETPGPAPFNSYWAVCGDNIVGPTGASCGSTPELCNKGWASAGNAGTANGNVLVGQGVGGSRAAVHHWIGGQCQGTGNHHVFYPNRTGYTDIWIRWYQKWPSGYSFGAEKVMTVNADPYTEGIFWGNLHCNQGAGGTSSTCGFVWQGSGTTGDSTVGSTTLTSGVWWAIQLHIKRNTAPGAANGIIAVYTDNCGAAGTSCSGSPTLRFADNAHNWSSWSGRGDATARFFDNWFEIFSNPQSSCSGAASCPILDNFKVSKAGPIGFAGATGATDTSRQTVAGASALAGATAGRVIGTVLAPRPTIRAVLVLAPLAIILFSVLIWLRMKARARDAEAS